MAEEEPREGEKEKGGVYRKRMIEGVMRYSGNIRGVYCKKINYSDLWGIFFERDSTPRGIQGVCGTHFLSLIFGIIF